MPRKSGAASRRSPKRSKNASELPTQSLSDRSLVRDFDRWLHRQPEIAAPSPAEESGLFGELLKVAQAHDLHLRTPDGVAELAVLLCDGDDEDEPDGAVAAAVATLREYVHFQVETGDDPSGWEEILALFGEGFPGAEVLEATIVESDQISAEVRLAALAQTRLVASVTELLAWIGRGRKVAPSGGVQRVDIAHAASLLGIAAIGVDRLPPYLPDSPALFEIDAVPDPVPPPTAIHARSMKDVPLLPSWWGALAAADLIEVKSTRVVPGASAAAWTAAPLPPLDLAEKVLGLTVGLYLGEDLESRSGYFAGQVAQISIFRLIGAFHPDWAEPPLGEDEFGRLLNARATRVLQQLADVGVLTPDGEDDFNVPDALRGSVARGTLAALMLMEVALDGD